MEHLQRLICANHLFQLLFQFWLYNPSKRCSKQKPWLVFGNVEFESRKRPEILIKGEAQIVAKHHLFIKMIFMVSTKGRGTSPICTHSYVIFKRLFSFFQYYVKEGNEFIINCLKFKLCVILLLDNPFIFFLASKFSASSKSVNSFIR